jgi:hypothetical protein
MSEETADVQSEFLRLVLASGKAIAGVEELDFLCNKTQTAKVLADAIPAEAEAVFVIGCGLGIQTVASLTGLPTMTHFFTLAEAGRAAIVERGERPVLLYMDLNGMKTYNDNYGFAEGDKLLQAFAKRMYLLIFLLLTASWSSLYACSAQARYMTIATFTISNT